mgnify:CR=1 FL=1
MLLLYLINYLYFSFILLYSQRNYFKLTTTMSSLYSTVVYWVMISTIMILTSRAICSSTSLCTTNPKPWRCTTTNRTIKCYFGNINCCFSACCYSFWIWHYIYYIYFYIAIGKSFLRGSFFQFQHLYFFLCMVVLRYHIAIRHVSGNIRCLKFSWVCPR